MAEEKIRIDRLLVESGLCESRTRAQALILAGQVVVDDRRVDKAGMMVKRSAELRLKGKDHAFVSRGGLKLDGALRRFGELEVKDRVAMDVGASTGGFSDCLLQRGVAKVFAVDVGYGQLAWKIAQDPRVVVMDRQNIRDLSLDKLGERVSLVVADCSFISLTKILAPIAALLCARADLVVLVKPQFEVGRDKVGKGGIVRSEADQKQAVREVIDFARGLGFLLRGQVASSIQGKEGNQEYLLWLAWGTGEDKPGHEELQ